VLTSEQIPWVSVGRTQTLGHLIHPIPTGVTLATRDFDDDEGQITCAGVAMREQQGDNNGSLCGSGGSHGIPEVRAESPREGASFPIAKIPVPYQAQN
jgi:hypothetical protein